MNDYERAISRQKDPNNKNRGMDWDFYFDKVKAKFDIEQDPYK